jgi:hypothetical protein
MRLLCTVFQSEVTSYYITPTYVNIYLTKKESARGIIDLKTRSFKNLNQIPVCYLGYAITRLELMEEPKILPENI